LDSFVVIYAIGNRSSEASSITVELIPENSLLTIFLSIALFSLVVTLSKKTFKGEDA
jgi:hypothetical protein